MVADKREIEAAAMALREKFGDAWEARGYRIENEQDGFVVAGDSLQFYLDAVANDVHAAHLMEFVRNADPFAYEDYEKMARNDSIDLDDSQKVFLSGKRLNEIVADLRDDIQPGM